jgi:hypothetical protein
MKSQPEVPQGLEIKRHENYENAKEPFVTQMYEYMKQKREEFLSEQSS